MLVSKSYVLYVSYVLRYRKWIHETSIKGKDFKVIMESTKSSIEELKLKCTSCLRTLKPDYS